MFIFSIIATLVYFFSFKIASAHEAYVLPYKDFWQALKEPFSLHAFDALKNPENLHLTLVIALTVIIVLILNLFLRQSKFIQKINTKIESYSYLGPHFVRVTIAIAFFFSAYTSAFLGPEIQGSLFPYPQILQIVLFTISFMILIGFMVEVAAIIGIIIFIMSFFIFGSYVFTYLNYLGELIILALFGMRVFSVDKLIFGKLKRFHNIEKYETVILRIFYGAALIYAAINVKLLHPSLTLDVVNTWNLTQFSWLFPSDPLLVTLGAGIVETIIGLFIILGFELRLTVLVSLFYITLSLLYFRELVWPHLLLYGISFNLLVQPQTFTLDHLLFDNHAKEKPWYKRILSPHTETGKSHVPPSKN